MLSRRTRAVLLPVVHTVPYALDAASGEEVWHYETGDWVECPPTVVDDTVYVGSYDSNVYSLRPSPEST
ncbi:hypothetical protein BRC67_04470 [Halobacteriales archaeon QH_3_68_24]|jgi:outer membrane protein assembly factor BamB|nr:MAG: hypothetical protein BRC67_04470 [Halobacteriales archaeon QH_3_68_24]